jgi:hypothetical protein
VEDSPNLLQVNETGWDKGSLDFELVVREVIITVLCQDGTVSDRLVVMRGVLRAIFSKGRVLVVIFRE